MFWVVNADGGGRETHIMKSFSPSTPSPWSATNIFIGSTTKFTLCGLLAVRYVDCLRPEQAECPECVERWTQQSFDEVARSAKRAARKEQKQGWFWWDLVRAFWSRSSA